MRLIIYILFVIIIFICLLNYLYLNNLILTPKYVYHQKIYIEKASNIIDKAKGLSCRKNLPADQGMLFIFDHEKYLQFWMYKMHFPIDLIWLDKNCRIINISSDQQPCSENKNCPLILSHMPAQYVLEVNSQFAKKHFLFIGQALSVCY